MIDKQVKDYFQSESRRDALLDAYRCPNETWPNGWIIFGQMGELEKLFVSLHRISNWLCMENTYKKRIADGLLQRKLAGKGAVLIESAGDACDDIRAEAEYV